MKRQIGRLFVVTAGAYLRQRYARQIRLAIGIGLAGIAAGAYLAVREVKEG